MNWGNSVWRLKVRGNHLGPSGPPARLEMDARQSLTVRRFSHGNWFSITSGLSSLSFLQNREVVGWRRKVGEASGNTVFIAKKACVLSGEQLQPIIFEVWEVVEDVCFSLVVCEYKTGMCQVVEDLLNVCENPRRRKRHMKKNVSLVSDTDQLVLEQKKALSLAF